MVVSATCVWPPSDEASTPNALRSPAWSCQKRQPLHVTNDTNVTVDTTVTIEIQVPHGAKTSPPFAVAEIPPRIY